MVTFFDYFQVICLALFLFLVVGISIYIRKTEKIEAVRLTLKDKGLPGFLEISLFAVVNIWIVEVLLYALHTDFRYFYSYQPALSDTSRRKVPGKGAWSAIPELQVSNQPLRSLAASPGLCHQKPGTLQSYSGVDPHSKGQHQADRVT